MLNKIAFATALLISTSWVIAQSPAADNTKVYIISPANGSVVTSPVNIKFGLRGMGVAPAGTDKAFTGHHHLLVDANKLPDAGQPMGADVKHFGGGQTETDLELSPGVHTLQLILGDQFHVPHQPAVISDKVTITVK